MAKPGENCELQVFMRRGTRVVGPLRGLVRAWNEDGTLDCLVLIGGSSLQEQRVTVVSSKAEAEGLAWWTVWNPPEAAAAPAAAEAPAPEPEPEPAEEPSTGELF